MAGSIVTLGNIDRLFAVFRKASRRETIRVGAIGGSITAGSGASTEANRWLNRGAAWFDSRFSASGAARLINGGIGSTESDYGSLRVDSYVLAFKPDIVFVDYAVNNREEDAESYEGLLRKLRMANPNIAVLPIMFCNAIGQGQQDNLVPICEKYTLPVISYRDVLLERLAAGDPSTMYSDDGVHPNDTGHELAGTCVWDFLDKAKVYYDKTQALLPLPPSDNWFEKTAFIKATDLPTPLSNGFAFASGRYSASAASGAQFAEWSVRVGGAGKAFVIADIGSASFATMNVFIDDVPAGSFNLATPDPIAGAKPEVFTVSATPGLRRLRIIPTASTGIVTQIAGVGVTI